MPLALNANIDIRFNPAASAQPAPTTPSLSEPLMKTMLQVLAALVAMMKAQGNGADAAPADAQTPAQPQSLPFTQPTGAAPVSQPAAGATTAPSLPPAMPTTGGRPPGDTRSAEDIIDAPGNEVLKNLGDQKDIDRPGLTRRLGDLNDPDPQKRADAAYNWAGTLNTIKNLKASDGSDRGSVCTNGKMEGITRDGDARHGTEAGVLKDFAETGQLPANGCLPQTGDTHVRKNGTNMDNFEWGAREVGKAITGAMSKVLHVVSNVLGTVLEKVLPGALGKFLGAAASSVAEAMSGAWDDASTAFAGGDVKKEARENGLKLLKTASTNLVGLVDPTGRVADKIGTWVTDKAANGNP